jgi:hypothetical protein
MKTIRVDKFSFEVAEHKGIQKITLHMPMTSAMSESQTINHFTTDELILNNGIKFITFNTFQGKTVTINIDYVIMVEYGKLVDVDNKEFFFVSENENYEVIPKGNYGWTRPNFRKG